MEDCESYFINNNIPYKKNITLTSTNNCHTICKYNYLLPYVAIYVHTSGCLNNIMKKINAQLSHLPSNYKYYLYSKQLNEFDKEAFDPRIIIIDDLSKVIVGKLPYYIKHPADLRSIVADDNIKFDKHLLMFNQTHLIIDQKIYLQSIILLGQSEIDKLSKLNIMLSDQIPDKHILISTKNAKDTKSFIFTQFHYKIQIYFVGYSTPTMYIPGITYQCDGCNKILQIEKTTCFCKQDLSTRTLNNNIKTLQVLLPLNLNNRSPSNSHKKL